MGRRYNIPRLTHGNLVAKSRVNPAKPKILLPDEIPIHPNLRIVEFPYTAEFFDGMVEDVIMSAVQDVETIEGKLGKNLGLKVTEAGLFGEDNSMVVTDNIRCVYRKKEGYQIEVAYVVPTTLEVAARVAIGSEYDNIFPYYKHPLPERKAKAYAMSEEGGELKLHGWGVDRIHSPGLAFEIFARNFVIVFNNRGLDRLEKEQTY